MRWLLPFSVLLLVAAACTESGREACASEPRVASDPSIRETPAAPPASTAPASSRDTASPASASIDVWSSREA
ncbi:MAG TPA: hypothetical protein PKA88_36465, partial [Polyangiaceae bacterium]|nr:hypothetical protein [Polyangiaceae bacterium]